MIVTKQKLWQNFLEISYEIFYFIQTPKINLFCLFIYLFFVLIVHFDSFALDEADLILLYVFVVISSFLSQFVLLTCFCGFLKYMAFTVSGNYDLHCFRCFTSQFI